MTPPPPPPPVAEETDDDDNTDTRRRLFERVSPPICPVTGRNHLWILISTYEIEYNPHIVKCDDCHIRRLVLYFDANDPQYEVFKKRQRWSADVC